MEKKLNFNTEVDDLTVINEFFQNAKTLNEFAVSEIQNEDKIHADQVKSA